MWRPMSCGTARSARSTSGEAVRSDGRVVPFFEAGSVGLNAAIFREVTRADQGDLVSIPRTFWAALRYRPARMVVELDDEHDHDTRADGRGARTGPISGSA